MDQEKIKAGVRLILEGVGEDVQREGLKETPEKVADMLSEILSGTGEELNVGSNLDEIVADDLIVIKDIPFYSMCEHHFLPFFGRVHLAYIPQNNKVSGFSALTKLVDHLSKRLQLQERLTNQIAEAILKKLEPQGVFVLVEAQQLCVSMRGSKKDTVKTITQAIRGDFPVERLKFAGF
jgi:GTP cyclohydrolase I